MYAPKERIVIHFTGMNDLGGGFITVVKPTDADDHFGITEGLGGQQEGKWEIPDGLAAGSYEARAAFSYGESIRARCRFEVK